MIRGIIPQCAESPFSHFLYLHILFLILYEGRNIMFECLLCSGFTEDALCQGPGHLSKMTMKSPLYLTLIVDRKLVSHAVQKGVESGEGNCLAGE